MFALQLNYAQMLFQSFNICDSLLLSQWALIFLPKRNTGWKVQFWKLELSVLVESATISARYR